MSCAGHAPRATMVSPSSPRYAPFPAVPRRIWTGELVSPAAGFLPPVLAGGQMAGTLFHASGARRGYMADTMSFHLGVGLFRPTHPSSQGITIYLPRIYSPSFKIREWTPQEGAAHGEGDPVAVFWDGCILLTCSPPGSPPPPRPAQIVPLIVSSESSVPCVLVRRSWGEPAVPPATWAFHPRFPG